jgi:hypothetical protein
MDIKINQLDTGTGNPYRIWDFINRNIGKNFPEERYILKSTKRGSWDIKPIFEKGTGMLYTLMREERFAELRKEVTKRNSAHYLQALAEVLNKNLQVQNEQICLFQEQNYYYDEKTKKIVQKIFTDLSIPDNIVKKHAIILFSSNNFELVSLRCCIIKSDLSIVEQKDWSSYIEANESTVAESISVIEPSYVSLANRLRFTQKANDKIGQAALNKEKKETEKEIY